MITNEGLKSKETENNLCFFTVMPQLKQQQLHAVSIQQQQKFVVFTIQGSKLLNIAQFFIFHIHMYVIT